MLNRHRSEGQSPERPVCKSILPHPMTPVEGSDQEKVVRPLSRGRGGGEEMIIFPLVVRATPSEQGLGSVRPQAVVFIFQN